MADRIDLSESQLLDALRAAIDSAGSNGADAFTSADLVATTGRSDKAVRKGLAKLIDSGTVVSCKVMRKNIAGIWAPRIGYRWISEEQNT